MNTNWTLVLREEAQRSDIVNSETLAQKHSVPLASVRQALVRLGKKGFVERVTDNIYVNKLALDFSPLDLVNVLRSRSYVSLESAMRIWGISTQTTSITTCVGLSLPREYRGQTFALRYRSISETLFWGFTQKNTRYAAYKIAEPEKALLDWVYFSLQDGIKPAFDELSIAGLEKNKLIEYAERYPKTALDQIVNALARGLFAA